MSKEFYDYLYNWAEDRNKKREEIQERKNQVNNFANSINERNNNNQNNMQNLQIQRTDILTNSNNTLKQQTVGENLWKQIFETARQNLANDISNTVDNAVLGFKKGINNVSETFSNAMYNTMNSRAQMSDKMKKNALDASLKREKDPEKQKQIQNEINNQDYLMSPTNLQKESNSQKQKYEEKNQELDEKIYNNIEQTSNPLAGKLAEISSSVGQMSPALIPGVGLPYMVASSKTDYLREAKQRGMDDNDSEIYSGIMSLANGVTGNIAIGKVGKTTQNFVNNLDGLKTLKEVGINLGNNFVQSAIMRPIGELTSKIVAGDDSLQYDYNNGGFKKLLSDSVKDGCDGAIMAGMLQLGTMGLTSPMRVYNKMKNGEKVNNQEIKTAFNEAKQKGIDIDNIITENFGKTLQQNQNNESLVKKDLSELPTMQDNKVAQQTTYQATKNANKSNVVATEGNHFNSQKNADKIKEIIQNDSNISADDKKAIIDATETLLKDNKFDKKNAIDAINSIKELSNVVADENKLDIGKKYLSGRKEIYNSYKKIKEYDNTAVENAKSLVRANAQGKRTREQWLQVAKQIGTEIADKSDKEVQKIAYKSWQDETPNTVDTLNRQGKKYVRLTSDDWIDEIYKSVSEQREKSGYKPKNETIEKLDSLYKEVMDENIKASVSPTEKNDLINSAKEYSLDGNSEDIQGISKMLSQRDIPAKFDAELFKDKNGNIDTNRNAVWKTYKDEKGNSKREIVFNPYADTKKTVQQVAVHELWHDMGGTEEGKKLAEQILKRNSKQKGYQEARDNLESTYSKVYDKNNEKFKSLVDDEEVADTLAQRLGDKDFIESLNKENKTAFQKIYDWVIDKLNKFTGGKVEKLYWQDVKNKFENVYKEEYKNTNKQNSKYSIQTDINGNKYIKVDTDQDIFEGIEPKYYNKIAKMYMQDYLKGETILNKNDSVNIGSKGINKYTNPTQKNKYLSEKMELTPELKNVLEIAKKVSDSTPTKDTSKFPNWQYYKFKFELGGKFFEGLINIGVDKTGNKHFYEINRIHPTSNSYVSTNKFSRMDPIKNNIAPNKNDVNTTTKYSMQESEKNAGSLNLKEKKQKQLDIIQKNNRMLDDYHTGIRKIEDIKTLAETLQDNDWKEYEEFDPDYTRKMADEALKTGKITVYSSHPIEQGSFVSPSKMEAESYSGNGKIYSKEININDVAWIDPTQGQYAKLNQNSDKNSDIRYSQNNESKWEKFLKESVGGKTKGKRLSELRVPTKENLELIRKMKSENPFTVLYNSDNDSDNKPIENNKNALNDETTGNKKETSNNDNGGKFRKHYKSIMESDLPKETRKIAKKLLGTDTYEPSSNQKIVEEADNTIATIGADESAKNIALKLYNNDKLTANDIAIGERLIQYYSKTGEWEKAQDTIQNVAMAGTELGQAVQAFSLIHKQTPIGQVVAMKKFVEKQNKNIDKKTKGKGKKFDLTDDMVQKILNSDPDHLEDTIDEVSRELGQQVPKTLIQKLDSWRYFSMLFNARTHIRNIIGNIGMGKMINPIKNVVGASIETVAQKAGLIDERTKTLKPANKETKEFAKADFANVKDIIANESKFDSRNLIQKYQRTFKHDVFEKTLGKLYDLNSNLLEKEDVFACKSAYKEALSNYMTANKLTPEYLKSGTKEANKALEKGRKYAIQQAQEVTFRQKNSLATLLNQLEDKNKLSKLIVGGVVPFKKTPLNIAKTGFEYSPVGIVRAFTTDLQKLRQNKINANQYIGNLSKGLTGTGIAVVGFSLANAGIITTGEDDNDKKQAFDEDRGSQTYSISIGGKSYSLDWAAPSVIPFFMGAGIYEAYVKPNDGSATGTKMEAVGKSIDSIIESLNPLVDMSMLSGLGSAIQSYQTDSTGAISTFITNAGKSYVGQFVPTLSKQIAKTVDDTERSTTSMEKNGLAKVVDSLRKQTINGIPFASKNLPAKTDIWGETKKKSPNVFERFLQQSILPWNEKSLKSTDVDKAVLDLYDKTGDPSALPKSNINKELTINSEKYRLNNEDFIQYKKEYGQQSYKLLQQLTASNEYKKMSDDQKLKAVSAIYTYANENNTIDYAKKHNIDKKPSSDYNSVKAIEKNGGNAGDYFKYLGQTQGMDKSSEKLNVLINSNIETKSKSAIYSNTIGSKDDQYNLFISKTGINVNEYLKFKKETSTSGSLHSDKDKDEKNISGSKEKKVLEYINNMKISTNQKLALFGTQFALPTSQKTQLINYISATVSHNDLTDVIKKYKKQNYKIDSNGNVTY